MKKSIIRKRRVYRRPFTSALERRKFMRLANDIAKKCSTYDDGLRLLNDCAQRLGFLLLDDLERLERLGFAQGRIDRIREYVRTAQAAFSDETVRAALDSAYADFSEAAVEYAKLVGALPLPRIKRRRRKKK